MFGTSKINPDYTFTLPDDRYVQNNTSKILSKYVGNSEVQKNDPTDKTDDNNNDNNDTLIEQKKSLSKENKIKNENNLEKIKNKKTSDSDSDENTLHLLGDDSDSDDDSELYVSKNQPITISNSFDSLAAAVGAIGGKITKEQLMSYLQTVSSGTSQVTNTEAIAFVKNILAQFDFISGGQNYITSLNNTKEAQDYTTITQAQVTSPIDIRI